MLLQSIGVLAQINIKRRVTSEEGELLIAVTIQEENTASETITNTDGNYEMTVSSASAILLLYKR